MRNQENLAKREDDMTAAVLDARREHQGLIAGLMHGPGDSEGAMHRAEAKFGLSYWSQHALRYRRMATPAFIERVHQAYLSMLEQSVRRNLETLKIEQAKGAADASLTSLIAESESLLARIAAKKVNAA